MIALGLTGFPLAHSLSPRIHQAALAYCGLAGSYALYPVQPRDARGLADLLNRVRGGELTGLNVTIPHKEAVLPLLDALALDAAAIGAVNTLFMRVGQLTGANTDATGFLSDLKRFLSPSNVPLKPEAQALVLGAGGAARAVVYALLSDGWQVTLAARRAEQAQALATDLVGIGLPSERSG